MQPRITGLCGPMGPPRAPPAFDMEDFMPPRSPARHPSTAPTPATPLSVHALPLLAALLAAVVACEPDRALTGTAPGDSTGRGARRPERSERRRDLRARQPGSGRADRAVRPQGAGIEPRGVRRNRVCRGDGDYQSGRARRAEHRGRTDP